MFNLEGFPDVIIHLKQISTICNRESSGWYSIFCPYCDDATRKFNPRHGHFHISPSYPFCHCFRCGKRVSLYNFLVDTKFKNAEILAKIKSAGNFTYSHQKTFNQEKLFEIDTLYLKLKETYSWFNKNKRNEYKLFKSYLNHRFIEINPIKFLISPRIYSNTYTGLQFFNHSGNSVVTRLIDNPKKRYVDKNKSQIYYFQNISQLDEKENLIITEGPIDLINVYNHCNLFDKNKSFYIAINGIHYKKSVADLINNFLLIGEYKINVIFDQNVKNMNFVINSIHNTCNELNPELSLFCFKPVISKDVSECMFLEQIRR